MTSETKTSAAPKSDASAAARHAQLFELIRQKNLAALTAHHAAQPRPVATDAPQHTVREFAAAARNSLLPQEQQALGITASFGR